MVARMLFLSYFLVLLANSSATNNPGRRIRPKLQCYICNSHFHRNCSNPVTLLPEYIFTCPRKTIGNKLTRPVGCRVLEETVPGLPHFSQELKITVRECAYNRKFEKATYSGSSGIRYKAYQCFDRSGKTPCNGGMVYFSQLPVIVTITFVYFIFKV